jgi:hypothetical protein
MTSITSSGDAGQAPDETAASYLKRVRKSSCYRALRTVVEISFLLSLLAWVLSGIGFVGMLRDEMLPGRDALGTVGLAVVLLIAWLLCLLVLIAARQAILLLIDIGDTVLDIGRRKKNANSESSVSP